MLGSMLATVAILLLGAITKLLTRDWFHPATIFACFWSFACGVPIIVAPENIVSASGPMWILLNAIFVAAGAIAGTSFACTSRSRRVAMEAGTSDSREISNECLRTAIVGCILLALLYVLLWLRQEGISVASLTNLRSLVGTAMKMSVERYFGTASTPIYIQLLLSFVYLAPLLGGALFLRRQKRSDTALALLTLLPSLLCFATESTRSSVLYGGTMWGAGYLSMRPYYGIKAIKLKRRSVFLILAAIPLLLLLISVGDTLRTGGASGIASTQSVLSNRVKTYFAGHIAALSQWLDNTQFSEMSPSLGRYTIAGVYNLIRPGTRATGVVSEMVSITTGYTNVFTYFRELIQDATLSGSLVLMFILAFGGGFAYRKVAERKQVWIGILAAFYAGAIYGVSSIFDYNSMILAMALYWAIWARHSHKKESLEWAQQAS